MGLISIFSASGNRISTAGRRCRRSRRAVRRWPTSSASRSRSTSPTCMASAVGGSGGLAIWSDVAEQDLTDYRHWLTREHTTERVTTSGFLAARVFRAARDDVNRFLILYELAAPEVLDGEAYLARLN